MNDLDAMLTKLAMAPEPATLDGIEASVFARIAARPRVGVSKGMGAATIAVALAVGIFGAGVSPEHASAMSSLSPLGPVSALAPSTLLLGEP